MALAEAWSMGTRAEFVPSAWALLYGHGLGQDTYAAVTGMAQGIQWADSTEAVVAKLAWKAGQSDQNMLPAAAARPAIAFTFTSGAPVYMPVLTGFAQPHPPCALVPCAQKERHVEGLPYISAHI